MNFQNQQEGVPTPRRLTKAGERLVAEVSARHDMSSDAAGALLQAIIAGNGRQAQFSHPELGGMVQWSSGGMLMIGDMFNGRLKARVGALADDLARAAMQEDDLVEPARSGPHSDNSGSSHWPEELDTPSSTGSQNGMHYAVFPARQRLAIIINGHMTIYDTRDHLISGVSQQQGSDQSLTLTSQHGPVTLASLEPIDHQQTKSHAPEMHTVRHDGSHEEVGSSEVSAERPAQDRSSRDRVEDDHAAIFAKIEGLANLHDKNIITAEEYSAKKAELLGRL